MVQNFLEIKVQQRKTITSRKRGFRCYLTVCLLNLLFFTNVSDDTGSLLLDNTLIFVFLGRVTNIPQGMVTDQFGMIGLLTFIRAAETDPGMVHLALGSDLTTLGLNLNSPE